MTSAQKKAQKDAERKARLEAEKQAFLATPVDRSKPRTEARSASKTYQVGQRGEYVYHLTKNYLDPVASLRSAHRGLISD